jgi:hypothetical protein
MQRPGEFEANVLAIPHQPAYNAALISPYHPLPVAVMEALIEPESRNF